MPTLFLSQVHSQDQPPGRTFPLSLWCHRPLDESPFRWSPCLRNPSLPTGLISVSEKWIESVPVEMPGHSLRCFLKGRLDAMITFEDGTYGVVDFKTSEPKPSQIPFYSRQLHAYAYALEHAAPGKLNLEPISRLGLLVEAPHATLNATTEQISFHFTSTWLEVPFYEDGFLYFIDQVLQLLELPEPPPASENCAYCQYRQYAREHGM
jgi:hypothetical protein